MSSARRKDVLPLSLRVIREWEKRIVQQKLLIADLKLKGRPIKGAEADLKQYQAFLAQLRNHRETMKEPPTIQERGS